jgi:hypothetical protein
MIAGAHEAINNIERLNNLLNPLLTGMTFMQSRMLKLQVLALMGKPYDIQPV